MTNRSNKTKTANIVGGIVGEGTVIATSLKNKVSSDSGIGSMAVGTMSKFLITDKETNVVHHQDEPTPSQHNSEPTERAGSSRSCANGRTSKGNAQDMLTGLQNLPIGAYGSISQHHRVEKDLVNNVKVYGNGRAVGAISQTQDVGSEKNTVVNHAEGHLGDQTSDDSFYKKCLSSKNPCYKLENKSAALIINNIFDDNSGAEYEDKYRDGAEKDSTTMKELFTKYLQFAFARTKTNVSSEDLPRILETFRADVKRNKCSSCFIIIMSHGGKAVNSILMDDMKDVDLYNDIVYKFSDHDDVRAIPKVFLVQACRNSQGPPLSNGPEKLKGIQDILIGHASSPNFPAGRNNLTGSLYINIIDEVFRMKAEKSTLYNMLMEVGQDKRLKEHRQYPTVEFSGFREYAFNFSFKTSKN